MKELRKGIAYTFTYAGNIDYVTLKTKSIIKSTIFWDITPCSPLNVNRRFGGTYRLHLQGRRISRERNQRERRCQEPSRLILLPWRRRQYVTPKHRLIFNGLHGVISQKIVLFITTAVRTSNPTKSNIFRQVIVGGRLYNLWHLRVA
jgi:hypothetical protein